MTRKTIKIDLDVFKAITSARINLDEDENDVLRRLLNIKPNENVPAHIVTEISDPSNGSVVKDGLPWTDKGISVPHGSKLKFSQNGVEYFAYVDNGMIVVGNSREKHLTPAAQKAAGVLGKSFGDNGWRKWLAQFPNEEQWRHLGDMRATNRSKK
ncbi:hypothetical protein CPJ18_02430 [Agrobacterium rosae]|uniref:RAMA domain-containing protein n=1 Tax=Agrobacterium rosae TaxID=1972867 RepID=A0AAE5VRS2_9HYPH|nr:hypothetical protein [Agrobacterium rosae]POO54374.1 hypothetical protein CPJ18_02430 [Agrobacterium rosae]